MHAYLPVNNDPGAVRIVMFFDLLKGNDATLGRFRGRGPQRLFCIQGKDVRLNNICGTEDDKTKTDAAQDGNWLKISREANVYPRGGGGASQGYS